MAGIAAEGDQLASGDALSFGHLELAVVPVVGDGAVPVADFDFVAVAALPAREDDDAAGDGVHLSLIHISEPTRPY